MTHRELIRVCEKINEIKREEYKTNTWVAYVAANVAAQANNGKGKKYHEYFPENNEETPEMRLKRELLSRVK